MHQSGSAPGGCGASEDHLYRSAPGANRRAAARLPGVRRSHLAAALLITFCVAAHAQRPAQTPPPADSLTPAAAPASAAPNIGAAAAPAGTLTGAPADAVAAALIPAPSGAPVALASGALAVAPFSGALSSGLSGKWIRPSAVEAPPGGFDASPGATLGRLWRGTLHLPVAAVHHWKFTVPAVLGTAALIAFVDQNASAQVAPNDGAYDSRTVSNDLLLIALPIEGVADSFLLRRDHNPWKTLLAGVAAIGYTTAAVQALKLAAGRERPFLTGDGDGGFFQGGNSFPSGHAMASFTVASFLAHRYPRHKWVAWVGYGLATTISVLRFTGKVHFSSDLVVGGMLGYLVGACAVNCR